MFFLRVHSVGTNHPLSLEDDCITTVATSKASAAQSNPDPNPKFSERRGVAHLFRSIGYSSLPSAAGRRSTLLFVVAVPNYLTFDDFIRLCGSRIDHVAELVFIRNNAMEDRYSVVIRLQNQSSADGFYRGFNGKKYSPGGAEVCHILFLHSVDYTDSAEIAGAPPKGCTELPTCPVCLERLDADTSGIASTLSDRSFQCPSVSKWTCLSCQVCRLCQQGDEKPACSVCGVLENLWVCIICGFVGCGRYTARHALKHWKDTKHCYTLELNRQEIWDYVGGDYVHRPNQSKVDGKIATDMDSRCMPLEGDCGSCKCSNGSGISRALYSSKVETIVDEYNRLLASKLETQRQAGDLPSQQDGLADLFQGEDLDFDAILSSFQTALEPSVRSLSPQTVHSIETVKKWVVEGSIALADIQEVMTNLQLLQEQGLILKDVGEVVTTHLTVMSTSAASLASFCAREGDLKKVVDDCQAMEWSFANEASVSVHLHSFFKVAQHDVEELEVALAAAKSRRDSLKSQLTSTVLKTRHLQTQLIQQKARKAEAEDTIARFKIVESDLLTKQKFVKDLISQLNL